MMRDEGGPAFPVVASNGLGHVADGMTLRDWFAGQMLNALGNWTPEIPYSPNQQYGGPEWQVLAHAARAKYAYAQADAMLAEREK